MATNNKIQIEIEVSGRKALATLNLTEDNIKNLGASFNEAKRSTTDFSSAAVMGLQDTRNAVQGLQEIWASFNAIFSQSFTLYERQISAEQRLEAVLRASGQEVEQNSARLREMASALQQATTFGDEEILEVQALFLTFQQIGQEALPKVTELAMDMASVFGGDLLSSAQQLAEVLEDPKGGMESLLSVGVSFTREQEEQIKTLQESGQQMQAQALILEELEQRFAGTARAIAATPAGQFRQLQNDLGDVREVMGGIMATGIGPFVSGLKTILTTSNELSPVIGGLIGLTGSLTGAYVALNITGLTPLLKSLATWKVSTAAMPAQAAVASAAVGGLSGSFRVATVAVRGFFASLGPVGWAMLGLSALVPVVGLLSSNSEAAAEASEGLSEGLQRLPLEEKRRKLTELNQEIEALRAALRRAPNSDWQQEQLARLEALRREYAQLSEATLMEDREALELEIAGQQVVYERVQRQLDAARQRLLRARDAQSRSEAKDEVDALARRAEQLQERITRYQSQLGLLEEQSGGGNDEDAAAPVSAEQQRQAQQLRLAVMDEGMQQELARLDQWHAEQQRLAAGNQDNLLLLEEAYNRRKQAIRATYRQQEQQAQQQYEAELTALQNEFRRLEGVSEETLLEERLSQIQTEYEAAEDGSNRQQELYVELLQARLNLQQERDRIAEEEAADEAERAEATRQRQKRLETGRQELNEAEARLALARQTAGMDEQERLRAEQALARELTQERLRLAESRLGDVLSDPALSSGEREEQVQALRTTIARLRTELIQLGEEGDDAFEWNTDTALNYAQEALGGIQDLIGSLQQLYRQDVRNKVEAEQRKKNAALDSAEAEALAQATSADERQAIAEAYEEKRAALEEEALQKKQAAMAKYFVLEQAASIGQATMSTYEAATKALTIPPPFGQILAGILTAAGLANVAVIAQQEPPAFAEGGLFRGAGGPTEDANLVRLSDGEYIVNAAATDRYFPLLEAINTQRLEGSTARAENARGNPSAGQNISQALIQSIERVGRQIERHARRPIETHAQVEIGKAQSAAILSQGQTSRTLQNMQPKSQTYER